MWRCVERSQLWPAGARRAPLGQGIGPARPRTSVISLGVDDLAAPLSGLQMNAKMISILMTLAMPQESGTTALSWSSVMDGSNPQLEAKSVIESGDVSLFWLWLQYRSLGGSADEIELEAFIAGIPLLQGFEVDILAATLQDLTAQ